MLFGCFVTGLLRRHFIPIDKDFKISSKNIILRSIQVLSHAFFIEWDTFYGVVNNIRNSEDIFHFCLICV